MVQILFNSTINEYTLKEEINNIKSIRKVPIKFKINDKTNKYRKDLLKKEIIN